MRLNSGQPASERREGVKPRLALIGGVEAGATIADIQTTAATEQLLPLNPANRRIRTRTYGGVGGEESQGSPLSRFQIEASKLLEVRKKHWTGQAAGHPVAFAIMLSYAGLWLTLYAATFDWNAVARIKGQSVSPI